MVQRLNGLRHYAIVSCNNQDCQVGNLCTTGTHGGKRLVTWGVNEGDCAIDAVVLNVHLVGTNVLSNATGFTRDDIRVANAVEQASLTVVDVTHDGDNWRTWLKVFFFVFVVGRNVETEAFE